jgi:hypothetical protein
VLVECWLISLRANEELFDEKDGKISVAGKSVEAEKLPRLGDLSRYLGQIEFLFAEVYGKLDEKSRNWLLRVRFFSADLKPRPFSATSPI